jgi:large subunit ribosomal protein L29
MKLRELRDLSEVELETRERELGEELFHLRIRRTTAQLSNPMKKRETRRELARVKTLLRARAGKGSKS